MAISASSMNATTGSGSVDWGSVLGVNSGGELGLGVLDIPQPNTTGRASVPGAAWARIAIGRGPTRKCSRQTRFFRGGSHGSHHSHISALAQCLAAVAIRAG